MRYAFLLKTCSFVLISAHAALPIRSRAAEAVSAPAGEMVGTMTAPAAAAQPEKKNRLMPEAVPLPEAPASVVAAPTPLAAPAVPAASAVSALSAAEPAVPVKNIGTLTPPAATPPAAASDSAPAKPASISAKDFLNPGDLVRIRMAEDPAVVFEGLISAAGTVPIPFLGEFFIARMTAADAETALSKALTSGFYKKATISVTLVTKGQGKIFVYGAVRRPGVILMPTVGDLTIIQALSYVDGLTNWASAEDAYILRRNRPGQPPQKIPLNLAQIFTSAMPLSDADIILQNDDVVCVPGQSGALFFSSDTCDIMVVGEVRTPGIVSFAPGEQRTVMRAIFKAGGFDKFAKMEKVRVIQYGKEKKRTEQILDATRIMDKGELDSDIEIKPGDMIIVPQSTFKL